MQAQQARMSSDIATCCDVGEHSRRLPEVNTVSLDRPISSAALARLPLGRRMAPPTACDCRHSLSVCWLGKM